MDVIFAAEQFRIGTIAVSNSVVATWIMIGLITGVILFLRWKIPELLEMVIDLAEGIAADFIPGPSSPYVPFLGVLMIFIATANLLGNIPMLFTPTRDINTPIALALVSLIMSFVFGIAIKGPVKFAKGFFAPMLPLDLIGYVSRTMSLTLRLFGNVIAGEIIVAVIGELIPVGVPLIMVALTSITGVLQAYVFAVLNASYIASSVSE